MDFDTRQSVGYKNFAKLYVNKLGDLEKNSLLFIMIEEEGVKPYLHTIVGEAFLKEKKAFIIDLNAELVHLDKNEPSLVDKKVDTKKLPNCLKPLQCETESKKNQLHRAAPRYVYRSTTSQSQQTRK